jgi:hypothetical protein
MASSFVIIFYSVDLQFVALRRQYISQKTMLNSNSTRHKSSRKKESAAIVSLLSLCGSAVCCPCEEIQFKKDNIKMIVF